MTQLFALAISIGGLAVVASWLFLGPLAAFDMQVWQAFLAWGAFFHNGGKVDGALKTVACMSLGAVVGMSAVILAGNLSQLGAMAAPVAIGLGVVVFVLAAHVSLLSVIPCSAYGFSCVGGLILLKQVAPTAAILPTLASILAGTVFAMLSEKIAGMLTRSDPPPISSQIRL